MFVTPAGISVSNAADESSRYTNVSPHFQRHVGVILLYFQPPFIFPASSSRTLWQSFRALGQCWSLISAWALLLYAATVGIMERLLQQKVRIHHPPVIASLPRKASKWFRNRHSVRRTNKNVEDNGAPCRKKQFSVSNSTSRLRITFTCDYL